jgi:hypothetical protein
MARVMRRPAWWLDRLSLLWLEMSAPMRTYMHAPQAAIPTCTHIDSTSGLVWHIVLRPHTSASSVLPSPLPTRMSLHHLTPSHPFYIPSLWLDVPRLSSIIVQESGMGHQAGLVLSSCTPLRLCISHPMMLACRRRPLDTGICSTKLVLGMSHYGPQCAHTDDTAAPSSSGHSISTRH